MTGAVSALAQVCLSKIANRTVRVGIIGIGYVGLPLAVAFGGVGIRVLGFDVDPANAGALNAGQSYIKYKKRAPAMLVGHRSTKVGRYLEARLPSTYKLRNAAHRQCLG